MEQEIRKALDIEDENPPRVNLTAVICTAIIAICATIVLCVGKPWNSQSNNQTINPAVDSCCLTPQNENQNHSVRDGFPVPENENETHSVRDGFPVPENENETRQIEQQRKAAEKAQEQKRLAEAKRIAEDEALKKSTLPLLRVSPAGTSNPYNGMRLLDASSRLLTSAEIAQFSKAELSLARNAIYARHGYQFNNAELKEFFTKQKWFKPSDVKIDAIPFTQIELDNIRLIKAREQKL